MTPLEPKPPDPSHSASFFFSWNFPCSSLPMYCQYLSEFYASFVSSKSSMDARSGNSRCGSDAVHEPWCFLPSSWVSQLESVTGSANLDVKLVNLGPLLLPPCDLSFCPREGLPSWAMPCFDLCSAAFLPSFPGYGFVPALSHLGKCRFGTFRYAPFPCAPRVCRSILWSDLLCLYQFGAIHALCDLIFFSLWRIAVPPLFVLSVVIEGPGGSLVMFCLCGMGFRIRRSFASYCNVAASLYLMYKDFGVLCWQVWIVSLLPFFFYGFSYSSLSMVRGRKMQIFWPMASPVTMSMLTIFWPHCYEQFFCARLRLPILCSFSQSFNSVMTIPVYTSIDWTFALCFLIAILLLEMHSFSLHSLWVFLGSPLSCSVFCIAVLNGAGPLLPLIDGVLDCEIPALVTLTAHSNLFRRPILMNPLSCVCCHLVSMKILDLGLVMSLQDCIISTHLFYGNEVGFLICTNHLDRLILSETFVICQTPDTICFDMFWWLLLWYYGLPILNGLYHCKLWLCSFLEHMGCCWPFLGTFCCRNVFWPPQYKDLCVTSCFQLRQPQYLAGLSMVYDAEIFALNLSETFLIPCVQGLWQVASPLNLLFGHRDRIIVLGWLLANVVDLFDIPPGSGHGFLSSMACCWSGLSVVSFLDFEKLCDVMYSEVRQSQSSEANPCLYYIHWICSLIPSVRNQAALYFFENFIWFLPRSAELRQGIFVDHLLQRLTPFSSLFFSLLECNIVVSLWLPGHCWKQSDGYLRDMLWLPIYFSAFCPPFIVVLLLSSSVFGTFLSRVMVRGGKMRILLSKASPLPSSCSLWCSRETFSLPSILEPYAFCMPWIVRCHALLSWSDLLVHTSLCLELCFTVPAYISSLEFDGWVCQHISSGKAEQAFSQFFWTFLSLGQLRTPVSRETYILPSVSALYLYLMLCIATIGNVFFCFLDLLRMIKIGYILLSCIMSQFPLFFPFFPLPESRRAMFLWKGFVTD